MTVEAFPAWFERLTGNNWPLATPTGLMQVARSRWATGDATSNVQPSSAAASRC